MKKLLMLLSFVAVAGVVPSSSLAATVNASVAASLTDAFKEIVASYTAAHPDVEVVANYGASGTLAKQIVQGAPADLFISANKQWLDYLLDAKAADPHTVGTLAANRLVFVGAKGVATTLADLSKLKRIAIGSPKSVPAGQYAEEALKKAGIYGQLTADGRLVQAQDVRQALVYADRGETEGTFVYKTDALLARSSVILFEVPAEMHAPIVYPMALTTSGAGNPAARSFMEYLRSAVSRAVLTKYGFVVEQER
jgi:molybdate transport system substrate-binding protein